MIANQTRNEQRKAITGKGREEMKARKAALRLLVSAMLVVGLLPVAALAADGEQAGDVEVPAQAQVEESAQDQAQTSADDQAQAANDQVAAPGEKAEATEPTTD